jgi:glycosyltransferase involved in cell wall biosynthesis
MHIGIDASRATAARRTGTENYARRLIQALLETGAPLGHTFTLYFRDVPPPGLFAEAAGSARVSQRVIPWPRLWTHARLSWELLSRPRPDVLFVPAHVLPAVHPLPTVVTVHDLGYRHFPDAHPRLQRLTLDWSTRYSARFATRLLADSEATRRDLAQLYRVPPEKVTVVYPGLDETLSRIDAGPVRAKYGLPEGYFLHVGTLQPRKNLIRLIDAAAAVPEARLVLAGRPGWLSAPILARAREQGDRVRLLDHVPDEDLAGLYSGARALVFPSFYEGFGFPVLEAMACGTPVICADTSSLPEVAGDAALLVNPLDTAAMVSAMARVQADPALAAALRAKGYAQARRFSWAAAARAALGVLRAAAEARNDFIDQASRLR